MIHLSDAHRQDLHGSGLTDETIQALGCYTASKGQVVDLLHLNHAPSGGLVFPFFDLNGQRLPGYHTVKLDTVSKKKDGSPGNRYRTPYGEQNRLFLPPVALFSWADVAALPELPIIITEGEKKSAMGCQSGLFVMAVKGVDAWKTKVSPDSKETIPLPDFAWFTWIGRTVYVCYDSDAIRKPQVRLAATRLAEYLTSLGACVRLLKLPDLPGIPKTGLDDYLMRHSRDDLLDLPQEEPGPVDLVDPQDPRPLVSAGDGDLNVRLQVAAGALAQSPAGLYLAPQGPVRVIAQGFGRAPKLEPLGQWSMLGELGRAATWYKVRIPVIVITQSGGS